MRKSTECYILGLLLLIVANTMHNGIASVIEAIIALALVSIGTYHSNKERNRN
jgi:hypothetical protein